MFRSYPIKEEVYHLSHIKTVVCKNTMDKGSSANNQHLLFLQTMFLSDHPFGH